jgi:hypothetical protein
MYGPLWTQVHTMNRIGLSLLAILAAVVYTAAPVRAASCHGASHQITLTSGAASPGSGTTATAITFSVRYADSAGCAPAGITVTIAGAGIFPLTSSGTSFSTGVTYSRTLTLPAGSHPYSFSASSGEGAGLKTATFTSVSPAAVVIVAPTPRPTPVPTPRPTPVPTPVPAPVQPRPPPPPPATAPVVPAATPPPVTPTPVPSPSPTTAPSTSPAAGSPSGSPAASPAAAAGVKGTDTRASTLVAQESDNLPIYLGMAAAAAAIFVVVRRRRTADETPQPVPAVAASVRQAAAMVAQAPAEAVPAEAVPAVTPLPPMRELIPPVDSNLLRDPEEEDLGPRPDEEGVPRWLRPSVREARGANNELRHRNWN